MAISLRSKSDRLPSTIVISGFSARSQKENYDIVDGISSLFTHVVFDPSIKERADAAHAAGRLEELELYRNIAEDVVSLISEHIQPPYTIIAVSAGGAVAINIAAMLHIDRLFLQAPDFPEGVKPYPVKKFCLSWDQLDDRIPYDNYNTVFDRIDAPSKLFTNSHDGHRLSAENVRLFLGMM